jgi:hypothetical protein
VSQICLYLDEDSLHHGLITALRVRTVDLVTAIEAGLAGEDDEVHLTFATNAGRVLYSANASDFNRLHTEWLTQGREHAGMVVVHRQRYSVGEQLRRLLHLINTKSAEEMWNQLLFL